MPIDTSKIFEDIEFGNDDGTEFRKNHYRGGQEFARFIPSNIDSVISAAKYVGGTKSEIKQIKEYFELNYE